MIFIELDAWKIPNDYKIACNQYGHFHWYHTMFFRNNTDWGPVWMIPMVAYDGLKKNLVWGPGGSATSPKAIRSSTAEGFRDPM